MKLIARSEIRGVNSDDGLRALDGIIEFERETDSADELIVMFEQEHPAFAVASFEIINDKQQSC